MIKNVLGVGWSLELVRWKALMLADLLDSLNTCTGPIENVLNASEVRAYGKSWAKSTVKNSCGGKIEIPTRKTQISKDIEEERIAASFMQTFPGELPSPSQHYK